jgi:hypothetical protein
VSSLVLVEGFPGSGKSTTTETETTPSAAELARWVGRYRVTWKGEPRECAVSAQDGRLVLDGFFWPHNGLLWNHDSVFDAEAWPFEVVFESAPDAGEDGTMSVRDQAAEQA